MRLLTWKTLFAAAAIFTLVFTGLGAQAQQPGQHPDPGFRFVQVPIANLHHACGGGTYWEPTKEYSQEQVPLKAQPPSQVLGQEIVDPCPPPNQGYAGNYDGGYYQNGEPIAIYGWRRPTYRPRALFQICIGCRRR